MKLTCQVESSQNTSLKRKVILTSDDCFVSFKVVKKNVPYNMNQFRSFYGVEIINSSEI